VVSVTHITAPAVQIGLLPRPLTQQGSPGEPHEFPPTTQPLAVQVPPPRSPGHAAPSAMQAPVLALQQAPPAQELSGQQRPPV
jgi:hypothetical protein